jgi:small conductance mechanosensitive channel
MMRLWSDLQTAFMANYAKWIFALLILVVGWILIKMVDRALTRFFDKTAFDRTLEIFAQRAVGIILWLVLLIIVLDNLGFDITGFVAGLGVLGFIVGFAVKDTLANLAAGMMLLINKPFKVGDRVEISGVQGKVKELNLAACQLVSKEGLVIIVNSKVWGNPIKNLSRKK